ncbi:MAG: PHP domain-containing protein [Anaerolineales bacterium]|nr:PHP domain-containing protein [Anaerolineales bacterium]
MFRIDFHTHTFASKDSLTSPQALVRAARQRGLDRIVVSDHNTISGAQVAYALDPELVIIGEEIMTTRGEILAAFVTEEIPAGLSPQETIRRLREQGAFISVSHPFDRWRKGAWRLQDLFDILPLIDAIEVFNARCLFSGDNRRAQEFAQQHHLVGTVGSDAHVAWEVGTAHLLLPPFSDAEGLRRVISRGKPQVRCSPFWVHFFSRYASLRKKLYNYNR